MRSCVCHFFCVPLHHLLLAMKPIDWKKAWTNIRKYVLNKYVITFIAFGLIFLLAGEQSVISSIRRQRKMRAVRKELRETQEAIETARRELDNLRNTDSLERFAREKYYMHAEGEDVFYVSEDNN